MFPPITASSSQFNVERVKEMSCVCVCARICQCVNMFESGSNVRDCVRMCVHALFSIRIQKSERESKAAGVKTGVLTVSVYQPSAVAI